MNNLTMVFRGTHTFGFDIPSTVVKADVPAFEAVCDFHRIEELRLYEEPVFTWAQAICVTNVEGWDFCGIHNAPVLVPSEVVRWVLCFPVVRILRGLRYIPETTVIPPDGDGVFETFYFFTGSTPTGSPIQAVATLDNLDLLSPQPDAKLALVRAKAWRWNQGESIIRIFPQDIRDIEIVLDSEVRIF